MSGKSNLTFEEALVSEHNVMAKAQNMPTELMAYVLRMTQYSKKIFFLCICHVSCVLDLDCTL